MLSVVKDEDGQHASAVCFVFLFFKSKFKILMAMRDTQSNTKYFLRVKVNSLLLGSQAKIENNTCIDNC